jgi:hypothetical protein
VALPLVACTALLDLQTLDFDADADGGGVPPRGEAGGPDGGDDAAPGDAGPADATTHCSDGKRHDFCDDFEGITGAIEDRWNKRKEVSGTGSISAEVVDDAPSPVTVFRSEIHRGPDGGDAPAVPIARLSKQDSPWERADGGAQPGVRIQFEVYFEAADVAPYSGAFLTLVLGKTSIEDVLQIVATRDESTKDVVLSFFEIYEGDGGAVAYAQQDVPARVALRTWTPIELEVQERAPGQAAGANLTVGTTTQPYYIVSSSRTPYFRLDLGANTGTLRGSDTTVLFDDVRVDYLP